ncbi:MAG TPA: PTS sugar transporter subunit IIA [Rectinema sp.]|jgi:PTS system nitrogen regulatory IIA component|nr:PTS sugar transporter subunit IIA [Rectinema sp.]HOR48890.1 PTS sugar transporter subunit IIA [Rectinema sp.]HPL71604.1 PTS sugar transporter subunit IIA [Rectinema sp.]HQQ72423.1 PTS sugar transporter subunit IIA [Rectinema sp.]
MDLKEILKPELISLDLKGRNKEEIIRELVDLASNSGKVLDKEETIQSVLEREYRMSTGMKHGIAIPHGKTTAVHELVACVGISKQEVDFDALDRKGCRIFIMTLSPIDKTGPHLQFLAEVGMLFRSEEKRQALLQARTKEEVVSILLGNA